MREQYLEAPEVLIKLIHDYFKRKKIIVAEVGVLHGYNAKDIINSCNIEKWFAIDPYKAYATHSSWHQPESQEFMDYQKHLAEKNLKGLSVEFIERIPQLKRFNIKLDFVYIDGDHSRLLKDLNEIWGYMKDKAIISGHDWNNPEVGHLIRKDVEIFFKKLNLKQEVFKGDCTTWWFYK